MQPHKNSVKLFVDYVIAYFPIQALVNLFP